MGESSSDPLYHFWFLFKPYLSFSKCSRIHRVTGVITRRYHWSYNSTYACLKGPACRLLFAERHTPQLAPRLLQHAVVLSSRRRRQHGGWLTLPDVKGWPPGIHEHEIEIGRFINNLRQFHPNQMLILIRWDSTHVSQLFHKSKRFLKLVYPYLVGGFNPSEKY